MSQSTLPADLEMGDPALQRSPRRQVPVSAQRAVIGLPLAFHAGQQCRIQGIALGAVPALAAAAVFSFFLRGLFHAGNRAGDEVARLPAGPRILTG